MKHSLEIKILESQIEEKLKKSEVHSRKGQQDIVLHLALEIENLRNQRADLINDQDTLEADFRSRIMTFVSEKKTEKTYSSFINSLNPLSDANKLLYLHYVLGAFNKEKTKKNGFYIIDQLNGSREWIEEKKLQLEQIKNQLPEMISNCSKMLLAGKKIAFDKKGV